MARLPLMALTLALAPLPAFAASVAVLPVAAPANLSGIAEKLASDLAGAAEKVEGVEVRRAAEVAAALGPEALRNLQECGTKPGCVGHWAGKLPAERLLVSSLERTETSYVVKLLLFDLKASALISRVERSVLIATRRLSAEVAAAVPGLLAGRADGIGKVAVSTSVVGAAVVLNGEYAGKAPLTLEARPGKHVIKVSLDGYLPVERFVEVAEGATSEVSLKLTRAPLK